MSKQIRLRARASRWSADTPVRVRAPREHARRAKRSPAAVVLTVSLCLSAILFSDFTGPGGLAQPAPQSPATAAAAHNTTLIAATASGALARPSGRAHQDPVAIKSARNAALIAATAEVLKETSEIRQLPILRPVQSSTQSRAEIERMLIKNLDEETTPAQIHSAEVTLKKLGLAPADFQYRALMLRLLTEQVAGYYDPRAQQFHLADWIDLDGQKPVMAHELTHALQDQHFNLRRFEHWPKSDSDAELAAHALIEGDATLAMTQYVTRNPLRALAFLRSLGASGMPSDELDHAPRALRETLLFPYQAGILWTRDLYQRGGWNEVSQAFTALPQSTEQIMHSEKYFAHEAPVKVMLSDITALLNAGNRLRGSGASNAGAGGRGSGDGRQRATVRNQRFAHRKYTSFMTRHALFLSPSPDPQPPTPASWRRLDTDVNGEWGFYLILDQFLKSPAESHRAAAGWGGDRYSIYEGPKGEVLYISLSTWDGENDAREFFDAYVKRTTVRYASTTPVDPTNDTESLSRTFRTSQGKVIIERRGARVLVLEGIPDHVDAKLILNLLR